MRPVTRIAWLLVVSIPFGLGCQNNPITARRQALSVQQQQDAQQQVVAQDQELRRRIDQLDANNRELHAQLAQSQRQERLKQDEMELLRDRLGQTAELLSQAQSARQTAESNFTTLQASTQRRGGALITANSSLQRDMPVISVPGVDVRRNGDVIRIAIPVDSIFLPGSAMLHSGAITLLDQVTQAVERNYPRQIIGIEGHTDNAAVLNAQWRNDHHLTTAQAMAVFEHLTTHHRINPRRLFVLGHGGNHPDVSNATSVGQTQNRRIELVVYPDSMD